MPSPNPQFIPIAFATFSLVFLSVFFIYLIYKYNKNLIRKNNEMFKAVIDAGEREKLELSRNLHDQVIPLIAISKLQVESFDYPESEESEEHKKELTGILAQSISEIRGICHSNSPILFKDLGLKKSLQNFFKQMASVDSAPKIDFQFDDNIHISDDNGLSVYRILLELFNNSLKYARCKNIKISSQLGPNKEILIHYSDDGMGTDILKPGHGMLSIKSRVTLLEGEVQFKSKMQEGFQCMIKLPSKLLI